MIRIPGRIKAGSYMRVSASSNFSKNTAIRQPFREIGRVSFLILSRIFPLQAVFCRHKPVEFEIKLIHASGR
jgi:hypothetical protein